MKSCEINDCHPMGATDKAYEHPALDHSEYLFFTLSRVPARVLEQQPRLVVSNFFRTFFSGMIPVLIHAAE